MAVPNTTAAAAPSPRHQMPKNMSLLLTMLFGALVFGPMGAEAVFRVEKATFKVNMPSSIKGTYQMAIANFGTPLYGATLTGSLVYPPTDHDACYPFPETWKAPKFPGLGASIIVVDRGNCPFTKKAYNSQQAGADAVMIVDNIAETLVTMDAGDDEETSKYVNNISVPVGLITLADGQRLETVLGAGNKVLVMLNWTDVLPHPDERVEWEFWTNSGDECGAKCDAQKAFIREFSAVATSLEQGGYTQFTPHYVTWLCPPEYINDPACVSQCINNGRYCCPDPDDDLNKGYSGRDVVIENLRTLCVFQQANNTGVPWKWWDYVTKFGDKCTMSSGTYGQESCATSIILDLGLDIAGWRKCVGDPDLNQLNALLDSEQAAQVSNDDRGDVTLLPTVVINEIQYRGKLDRSSVLSSICAGFKAGQAPEICNDRGLINDKCGKDAEGYLGCLANSTGEGLTGCAVLNQWPYYQCVCPKGTNKVTKADGSVQCEEVNECLRVSTAMPSCSCERCTCKDLPAGEFTCTTEPADQCKATAADPNPGGCWKQDTFSACFDNIKAKKDAGLRGQDPAVVPAVTCKCPAGWTGDGLHCVDVDECLTKCKGDQMVCTNTPGSFTCGCSGGFASLSDTASPDGMKCFEAPGGGGRGGGSSLVVVLVSVIISCIVLAGSGFLVYRWRLRSYMDQEIRAIMSQYMPLEEDGEGGGGQGSKVGGGHHNGVETGEEMSNAV